MESGNPTYRAKQQDKLTPAVSSNTKTYVSAEMQLGVKKVKRLKTECNV